MNSCALAGTAAVPIANATAPAAKNLFPSPSIRFLPEFQPSYRTVSIRKAKSRAQGANAKLECPGLDEWLTRAQCHLAEVRAQENDFARCRNAAARRDIRPAATE